jgi:hypothetical protein
MAELVYRRAAERHTGSCLHRGRRKLKEGSEPKVPPSLDGNARTSFEILVDQADL